MTPGSEQRDTSPADATPNARRVHTAGRLSRVPNQPKTPVRGFRIPDDLYREAQQYARENGEDLSSVVRAGLERYVKRERRKRKRPRS